MNESIMFLPFAILQIFVGLAFFINAFFVLVEDHRSIVKQKFFATTLCIGVWALTNGMLALTENVVAADVLWKINFIGCYLFFATWIDFYFDWINMKKRIIRVGTKLCYIVSITLITLCILSQAVMYKHTNFGMQVTYQGHPEFVILFLYSIFCVLVSVVLSVRIMRNARFKQQRDHAKNFVIMALFLAPPAIFFDMMSPVFFGYTTVLIAPAFILPISIYFYFAMKTSQSFKITLKSVSEYILRSVTTPVLVLDNDNTVVLANHHADDFLTNGREHLAGKNIDQVLGRGQNVKHAPLVGTSNTREIVYVPTRSGEKACDLRLNVIRDKNNEILSKIVILNDISEMQVAQATLEREYLAQKVLKDISILLSSDTNLAENIAAAIAMVGKFLNLDRILIYKIFEDDGPRYADRTHLWAREGLNSPPLQFTQLSSEVVCDFYKWFGNNGKYAVADVSAHNDALCQKMAAANIKSAMGIPLFQESRIDGVLCLQTLTGFRNWTDYELNFAETAGGMIATALSREALQKEITSERDRANEASLAKTRFLSNMSHEIRTPLNAIIGMTRIGKLSEDVEKMRYSLGRIDEASVHLLGLINDILDMSKIEVNKLQLEESKFSFIDMIERVYNVVNIKAEEKNVNLLLDLDPQIPDECIGDELRLSQVIINLLSNAVKFTQENGCVKLIAKFAHYNDDNGFTINFEVIDSGIGINEEDLRKLFVPFTQADAEISRKFGGTGLGLVISKSIIEKMRGAIGVRSELGCGSCFYFYVSLKQNRTSRQEELEQLAPTDPEENIFGATAKTYSACRVLVVDDVEINREIATAFLEETKVTIDSAENGEEAVRIFSEHPEKYDLILMDIQMPVLDGLEATRQIRALGGAQVKSIPILAMTANAFKEDIENCLRAGMDDHIGKPVDAGELLAKMDKYLAGKEDQDY